MPTRPIREIWRGFSLAEKIILLAFAVGIPLGILSIFLPSSPYVATSPAPAAGMDVPWFIIIGFALYFLPTLLGWKKRNSGAIFALNLLLGWTVIGWIVALVWALTVDAAAVIGRDEGR